MAKPKGFSTMCWLGIILSSIGIIYSIFVVIWQGWLHGKLNIAPSLVTLGIIESDAETFYESILLFVYMFQCAFLYEMLQKRLNRIRGLLITFAADILISYLELQLWQGDALEKNFLLLFLVLLYVVPTIYFCRQPIYAYLDKS